MRKRIGLFLIMALIFTFFAGCGKTLKVENNTVYVQKSGKILGATVESFDKDYYVQSELEDYIKERVGGYTSKHDKKSVEVDEFSVEEDVARLNIKYAGYEDYADFNEVTMFVGTLPQALAEGYDFNNTFVKVEDGKLGKSVNKEEVTENSDYKVVILSEKVDVMVDGTVKYVSKDYTTLKAKNCVSVKLPKDAQDGEELALTYIIYK